MSHNSFPLEFIASATRNKKAYIGSFMIIRLSSDCNPQWALSVPRALTQANTGISTSELKPYC